jgi:transcriptional regulator with XRE-family HTH domain
MTSGVKKTPPTELAATLRRIRESAGLTQTDMGRRLRTGGNRVCDWETGNHEPQLHVLRRYADFAGVTVADLFAQSNPRPYAAAARALCPESDPHHDRVWFCTTCRMLEQRLTPISDLLRGVLADADLTVTWRRDELLAATTSAVSARLAERPGEVDVKQSAPANPGHHPT